MGFICWAWRDSFESEAGFAFGHVTLWSSLGGATIGYYALGEDPFDAFYQRNGYPHPEWSLFQPVTFCRGLNEHRDGDDLDLALRKAGDAREFHEGFTKAHPRGSWLLFIPHWLILIAVALPWAAMLLWRARRRKSIITP